MNITAETELLREVVRTIAPLAKKFQHLALWSINGRLEMAAHGHEVSAKATIDCEIKEIGQCIVPADFFLSATQLATGSSTTIATRKSGVSIRSGSMNASRDTPAEIPPPLNIGSVEATIHCDGNGLGTCIDRVEFYSKQAVDARYSVECINLCVSDGFLYAVTLGAGGGCMAVAGTPCRGDNTTEPVLIQRESAMLARRLIGDGPCSLSIHSGVIHIANQCYEVEIGRASGRFPDWKHCIPRAVKPKVSVQQDLLMAAIKQMGLVVGEAKAVQDVVLSLEREAIRLERRTSSGEATCLVPIEPQDREATCHVDIVKIEPAVRQASKLPMIQVHIPADFAGNDVLTTVDIEFSGARYYIGTLGRSAGGNESHPTTS